MGEHVNNDRANGGISRNYAAFTAFESRSYVESNAQKSSDMQPKNGGKYQAEIRAHGLPLLRREPVIRRERSHVDVQQLDTESEAMLQIEDDFFMDSKQQKPRYFRRDADRYF